MKKPQRGFTDIVLLVLVASIAVNLWLWTRVGHFRKAATVAETKLTAANGETQACNSSIEGLELAAFARGKAAGIERAQAKADRAAKKKAAQAERDTPATTPGDDCKSAQDRVKRILSGRSTP